MEGPDSITGQDGPCSHVETTHDEAQDCANSQQNGVLDTIRASLSLAESYLPEIGTLLERVAERRTAAQVTGLPTFLRNLKRTEESLKLALSDLRTSTLDEDALTRLERKLEASLTEMARGATHWDILKRCRGLVAVNRSFQGSTSEHRKREMARMTLSGREKQMLHRSMKEQGKVEVDVVEGGDEWLEVKTLQPDRLVRQMTDGGWAWGDHAVGDDVDEAEWEDVPLAKQIRRLAAAARMNRHEYRIPHVRVVLPNIRRGDNQDVDALLDQLSRVDPLVRVTLEDGASSFLAEPLPALEESIERLLGDELAGLTPTLNMDHTILVDLASDLTHLRLEPQPWQASTTRAQIQDEARHGGLMARTLYPILDGRVLVCTREAADHFHEVLGTVGTATERERGGYLVPLDPEIRRLAPEVLRARFQRLSVYPLPPTVQMPVVIIDEDWSWASIQRAVCQGRLPPVALDVARCGNFKSSKLSIFMHGWATGMATVTSNKEVRGQIRTWLEANRRSDNDRGPRIWRVDVTRNLLAKSATSRDPEEQVVRKDATEESMLHVTNGKGAG
ncbi:hypothetical protein HIM_00918 [Hirsutella minnesotensis 3608]|nr:hypothetical protein HIM_00918 [Hirsutella minnesotensis 3608]